MRLWDGCLLPSGLHARLKREYERYRLVKQQINQLELEREAGGAHFDRPGSGAGAPVVAAQGDRDELGLGLCDGVLRLAWLPEPAGSGLPGWLDPHPLPERRERQEQGISKAGNRRIRAMAIEIAWSWLRLPAGQPAQPLVSRTLWKRQQPGASDRHRCPGPQAVGRALAIPREGCTPGRRLFEIPVACPTPAEPFQLERLCSLRPPYQGIAALSSLRSPPLTGARPPGNRSAYEMAQPENVHPAPLSQAHPDGSDQTACEIPTPERTTSSLV